MRVLSIVGARPNFMKIAPVIKAFAKHAPNVEHRLVHTGQHYDKQMSESFFVDLEMPQPDINLAIGSGSHAEQTGKIMIAIEPVLVDFKPDVMIVVGDVNSTVACTLTAKKIGITVAHVEAGLRSFDRTMPEEINRLCTDVISDFLFTTDHIADRNLAIEGVDKTKIHRVGNVMIDTMLAHMKKAEERGYRRALGLNDKSYATLTLHRPANVDCRDNFVEILTAIQDAIGELPVIFPIHPRTRAKIAEFGLEEKFTDKAGDPGIHLIDPLGYLEFLNLNQGARLVMTDSGGLQEETTILGVPCVTLRDNTERPITIEQGTNIMGGTRRAPIMQAISKALTADRNKLNQPDLWDGKAAERIVKILTNHSA